MTPQYISYNCMAEAKGACVSHGHQGLDGQSSNVIELELGHTLNSSTRKPEEEGSAVQGQPELYKDTLSH